MKAKGLKFSNRSTYLTQVLYTFMEKLKSCSNKIQECIYFFTCKVQTVGELRIKSYDDSCSKMHNINPETPTGVIGNADLTDFGNLFGLSLS